MNILLPHDHFDADHLAKVIEAMQSLGAPTIKAVRSETWDAWIALEGAHRLRAAQHLGFVPIIDEVEYSETATTDEVVPGSFQDCWTVAEICDSAATNTMLRF